MKSVLAEQPKRMAREKRLLDDFASTEQGFSTGKWSGSTAGEIALSFKLKLPTTTFEGTLVYPQFFPEVPCYIKPQKQGESWSGHQYLGTGVFCLERGPDNWHAGVTGLEMVKSLKKLLWSEALYGVVRAAGPVPSRHQLSLGQRVRSERNRFVVTPGLRAGIGVLPTKKAVPLQAVVNMADAGEVTLVTHFGNADDLAATDVPDAVLLGGKVRTGWMVMLDTALKPNVAALDDLRYALGDQWPFGTELLSTRLLLVVEAGREVRAFAVPPLADESEFTELAVVDFGQDDEVRVPANYKALAAARIAIVGMGSLGSKIAVSLARAGVGSFLLIDADVLGPQNLVRNDLDWRAVGFSKVNAVAARLRAVAAGVNLVSMRVSVAGQENPQMEATLSEGLGSCDLVIDATANPAAFVMLAAVCRRAGVAMAWGEVFAGGIGALMGRSRPGIDADPLSVRAHVAGVLEGMEPVPGATAKSYGLDIGDQVLVAGDAEVGALAASLTMFAIDAVCSPTESQYPVAAYLLGYKKCWVFEQPFHTIPIDCSSAFIPEPEKDALTAEEESDLEELISASKVLADAADNAAS